MQPISPTSKSGSLEMNQHLGSEVTSRPNVNITSLKSLVLEVERGEGMKMPLSHFHNLTQAD